MSYSIVLAPLRWRYSTAENGEEILIERAGRAATRLVMVLAEQSAGKRVFGQNLLGITYLVLILK